MDRKTYREAFDKLTFSPDFQARTQALLHQRAQAMEQEETSMKIKHLRKPAVFAAGGSFIGGVGVRCGLFSLPRPGGGAHREHPAGPGL